MFHILHQTNKAVMKTRYLLFVFFSCIVYSSSAQLSSEQSEQLDSLFLSWNVPNHPGGSIAVMKDGQTVYSKSFGLASLEYMVPNNNGTIYNLASVSKQFTAMGIVLLDLQGKLSVEDDIRKYLPELPDFGHTITISHMLHHTSGLRSLHALLGLAGWRGDDSRSNADINRFMLTQKELNFVPGDEYLYCNTGYMLCVNIIEKITGEPFTKWMKENIFEPLNMYQTYVEENYSRIVPGNATSYYGSKDGGFERAVEYWGYVGSGNMHSTTSDLLIWLDQFRNPNAGWEEAFEKLQTKHAFNNGKMNDYAFGVTVNDDNGNRGIGHGGAIGGFRSNIAAFPDEGLNVVVLTNFSSANAGGKLYSIAQIFLDRLSEDDNSEIVVSEFNSKVLSTSEMEKFEGWYWNDQNNFARNIYLKSDTLRYSRSITSETPLIPVGQDSFRMDIPGVEAYVQFDKAASSISMKVIEGDIITDFESFKKRDPSRLELMEYEGIYYSPEINSTYKISLENGKLTGNHVRHGDFPIKELKKDVLEGGWPFGIIKISRDS